MFAFTPRARGARSPRVPRLMDKLAGPQVMEHLLRRECSRAARSGTELSLVLFRLPENRKASLATYRLARTMLRRARMTDEVGWYDDEHLGALLPETSSAGARSFAADVRELVAGRMDRPRALIYTYPKNWVMSDDRGPTGGRFGDNRELKHESAGNGNRRALRREELVPAFKQGLCGGLDSDMPRTSLALHEQQSGAAVAVHAESHPSRVTTLEKSATHAALTSSRNHEAVGLDAAALDDLLIYPLPLWKRVIDILGALVALILFSPLLMFAALAIKLTSSGPIIFNQRRAGLGGRPFTIYKLRTMSTDAEARKKMLRALSEQDGPAFKLTNDPRITRIGHILRKTSIDELPQLWNVIKGDMSLVGPRPLPVDESQACELWQQRRLDVTPGLTCIWQVEGRSRVTFDEWVRMDVKYIRRRNILHDLSLMFRTIPAVLLRRGAR